ncbi:hypothetical protein CCYA_CCYA19G4695 [Cyanidiococcus yangmingshanensis]|nr:hypothetical protein CCYA_CCYA19G4695 [Cyanidiococcus yangmingshanensis]
MSALDNVQRTIACLEFIAPTPHATSARSSRLLDGCFCTRPASAVVRRRDRKSHRPLGLLQANRGKSGGSDNPFPPEDQPDETDEELLESLRRRMQELQNSERAPAPSSSVVGQESSPLPAKMFRPKAGSGEDAAEAERSRSQALFVVASIFFLSVISGVVFVYLYDIGAVHGGGHSVNYKPPVYGTETYINPYELLERESFSN